MATGPDRRTVLSAFAAPTILSDSIERPAITTVDAVVVAAPTDSPVDNLRAFQRAIALAAVQCIPGDTIGAGVVEIPAGRYKLTGTLNLPPWIKLRARGAVQLQWIDLNEGPAIRISNMLAPAELSTGKNAANLGPCLNGESGVLCITGPGGEGVCIEIGNANNESEAKDCRDVSLSNIVISGFGNAIKILNHDTYMLSFTRIRFEQVSTPLAVAGGKSVNSGERISFTDCTFGSGGIGNTSVHLDADAFDLSFFNCSFDFSSDHVVLATKRADYLKLSFHSCHFEGSSASGLIERESDTSDRFVVQIFGSKLVPTTSRTSPPAGARADGRSTAYTALFRGGMSLAIYGLQIGGFSEPQPDAENGLFLCDERVEILAWSAVAFTEWGDALASRSLIRNYNSNFADPTGSSEELEIPCAGWRVLPQCSPPRAHYALDTKVSFAPSLRSIRLTASKPSSSFGLLSDAVPVLTGERLRSTIILRFWSTASAVEAQFRFHFLRDLEAERAIIASATRVISGLNITTEHEHGISAGTLVTIQDSSARHVFGPVPVEVLDSHSLFCAAPPEDAPLIGRVKLVIDRHQVISSSSYHRQRLSEILARIDPFGGRPTEGRWLRSFANPQVIVPSGCSAIRYELHLSNLPAGEDIWLGEVGLTAA